MHNPKFLDEILEGSIDKMRPSITYYHPWYAKPWEHNFMEHLEGMLGICYLAWHGFYPFGDVIHGGQDILAIMRLGKSYHIDNSLDVKKIPLDIIC